MSDYQAVYDATFRQFDGTHHAIESLRQEVSLAVERTREHLQQIIGQHDRPSVLYRPSLGRDGDQWCALYGSNIQEGVCGFGSSPADAMADFDRAWTTNLDNATRRAVGNVRV